MELIAVSMARVVGLLEIDGAVPRGQVLLPEGLKLLAERYGFLQIPQSLADLDLQKGIDLTLGKFGEINIEKLTLFSNGIVADTRSSTSDSRAVIEDLLNFVHLTFGATVQPTRWMHLSHIIFRSDFDLGKIHPALGFIISEVGRSVTKDYGQDVNFSVASIAVSADLALLKLQPASFTLERRSDTPFSANIYFSSAPIDTDKHIKLLTYFESALK